MVQPLERVPVAVLTGFLGSGKTTLLNRLLRQPDMTDTAVIVNELGTIGLDHLLIARGEDNVVLLDAGCLCCGMLNTFKETLADLWHRRARGEIPAFSRVVVETTGLADPAPILQSLLRDSFLTAYFRLGAVVVTVDAVLGEGELDHHPEAVKQAALADRLMITKTDLTGGTCPPNLRARLADLNPSAVLVEDGSELTRADLFARAPWVDRIFAADAQRRHAADIHADAFVIDADATWSGIAGWVDFAREFFGAGLLRCKGLLALAGDSRPVLMQGVQTVFAAPALLDVWPSADSRSRLVCISQGLDPTVLRATLKLLHAQPGTYRPASVRELMEHA